MSKDASGPLLADRAFYLFKNYCDNYSEISKSEKVTKREFESFMEKVSYIFPYKTRFRLVKLRCQDKYVPIDSGICKAIVYLNEHGYYTRYCCEGHGREGYIYFDCLDIEKSKALIEKFTKLSNNKVMKVNIETMSDSLIFRFSPLNSNYTNMLKIMEKELTSL